MDLSPSETVRLAHERFRALATSLSRLLASAGVTASPWRDPALPNFSRLSADQQMDLLAHLEIYAGVLAEAARSGMDVLRAPHELTFAFLARARLQTTLDLVRHLEAADYIAAYNHRQQVVFLSPNHFWHMTYSIEELHCRPWFDLFRRNESIEKALLERALKFARGQATETVLNTDLPPHFVTEIDSPAQTSAICRSKLYSPLFRGGKTAGFVSVNKGLHVTSQILPP